MGEEFILGCMDLQGQANKFDMANLQYDMRQIRNGVASLLLLSGEEVEAAATRTTLPLYGPGSSGLFTTTGEVVHPTQPIAWPSNLPSLSGRLTNPASIPELD